MCNKTASSVHSFTSTKYDFMIFQIVSENEGLGMGKKNYWILSITLLITFSYLNFCCFERLGVFSPSFASTCLPSIRASEPQFIQINQALSTSRFFSSTAQGIFDKADDEYKDILGFQCTHVMRDETLTNCQAGNSRRLFRGSIHVLFNFSTSSWIKGDELTIVTPCLQPEVSFWCSRTSRGR